MIDRRHYLTAQLPYFPSERVFSRAGLFLISYFLFLSSCSTSKQISRSANILLKDSALAAGHVGISFFEPATGKTWYSHNADKYFIPASNTKLFTLYAGLKYLPDSLPGIRYHEVNDTTIIEPTGDPTFLHSIFPTQPVLSFLQTRKNIQLKFPFFTDYIGKGWAWDDYKENYMAQRSSLPMYGNVVTIVKFNEDFILFIPDFFKQHTLIEETTSPGFSVEKTWDKNELIVRKGNRKTASVPFRPDNLTIMQLLEDTLNRQLSNKYTSVPRKNLKTLYSQPADSLFKSMMHQSNNFFAEQTLLMASNEMLGEMDDGKMVEYMLQNDLKDSPQSPKWVDGSGLSRYNLFTPESFVYILNKMRSEFGVERLKNILPTGGEGTLGSYYEREKGFIYAKTGTLSNNLALSGYIYTRKNKLLLFSIMVNNFPSGATPVRKAIEKFVQRIIRNY